MLGKLHKNFKSDLEFLFQKRHPLRNWYFFFSSKKFKPLFTCIGSTIPLLCVGNRKAFLRACPRDKEFNLKNSTILPHAVYGRPSPMVSSCVPHGVALVTTNNSFYINIYIKMHICTCTPHPQTCMHAYINI